MPFANNQGVHIHYEVMGDGPPLVLQHGFYGSWEDWIEFGYTEALRQKYHLILLDARGHGDSDKPHDPDAYTLQNFAADVVAVLDDLSIDKSHYLGYSMGGWIGYGMAKYAPARLHALLIGGAQPYGRNFGGGRELLADGIEAWMTFVSSWGDPYSVEALARIRQNDFQALLAVLHDRPDISEILPSMRMHCMLYVGEADDEASVIERCASEMPHGTFVCLPGLNHLQVNQRGRVVTPHILKFLASCDGRTCQTGC
jgi:pimeloyl-ACP methyl ester carboxylesterase